MSEEEGMNGVRLVASEPVGFVGRWSPRFAPEDIDGKGPIGPCARCETGPRWHFTFLSASNSLWLAVPEPGPRIAVLPCHGWVTLVPGASAVSKTRRR